VDREKELDGEVLASLCLRLGYTLALVFLAEHWSLDRWITHVDMERSSEYQEETFIPLINELIYLFRDFLPQLPIPSLDRGKSKSGIVVRSKLEAQHHSTHSESLPVYLWESSSISDPDIEPQTPAYKLISQYQENVLWTLSSHGKSVHSGSFR
jgi:hypothetical protein